MKKTIKILLTMLIILAMFVGTGVLATEVTNDIGAGENNTVVNNTVTGSDTGTNNTTTNTTTTTTGSTTETGEGTEGLTWTDFSNAEIKLVKDGNNRVILSIKNVEKKADSFYFWFITKDKTQPSVDYDNIPKENKLISLDPNVDKYVELNQDLYLWVLEEQYNNGVVHKFIVEGLKLERPEYPKYTDIYRYTVVRNTDSQIVINIPIADGTERKANLKIGEITDTSLLRAIKNNENGAWEKLLNYSKNSNTLFDGKVTLDNYGKVKETINNFNVKFGSYYFMYVELEDENGKYYPAEGVTLAMADGVIGEYWGLYFLGSNDFKWNLGEDNETVTTPDTTTPTNTNKDNTKAKGSIPYAGGATIIVLSIAIISIAGTIAYIKNRDLKGV